MSEELHTFPFPILKVFTFINEHIGVYLMRYRVGSCVDASVLDGRLRFNNNYDHMNNTDKTFFQQ